MFHTEKYLMVSCLSLELDVSGKCYLKSMVLVPHATEDFRNGEINIFDKLWTRLLQIYDLKKGIKWNWQSLDSISVKSPLWGR